MVKFRLASVLTVGLVMFLSASMVMAQNQDQGQGRRQRGQGGGGGRGGFGGGGFGFGPRGVLGLIGNEAVQKELAVDTETTDKLKKVSEEARNDLRPPEGQGGFQALQGLSDDERRAKMDEMRKAGEERQAKVTAKYEPQLKEILNETQYTRLQQIYWQSNLQGALADADVIKAIDLTKEQQDKVAAVTKEYGDKQRELFQGGGQGGGGGNRQEGFAKMMELNKERETKTLDVLSAEQKEKFTKLKGKEFDVAQLRGGFGGGRGGRGGGGGNRPGGRPATDNNN